MKEKLSAVAMTLALCAVVVAVIAVREYIAVRPADAYTDKGVYTFKPYEVLPVQVKGMTRTSGGRRRPTTRTVYKLYYKATDGSGYRYVDEVPAKSFGEKRVKEGVTVDRRVLSVAEEDVYITVEPDETAESYTSWCRRRYILYTVLSVIYIVIFIVLVCKKKIRIS